MADSPARSRPCFSERASLDGAGAVHLVSGHRPQSAEIRAQHLPGWRNRLRSRDTADILYPRHGLPPGAAGRHRPVASSRDGQPGSFAFDGLCERAIVAFPSIHSSPQENHQIVLNLTSLALVVCNFANVVNHEENCHEIKNALTLPGGLAGHAAPFDGPGVSSASRNPNP